MAGAGTSGGIPAQGSSVCVFLDSSNFKYVFEKIDPGFDPARSNWDPAYQWTRFLKELAKGGSRFREGRLLRGYWYVPGGPRLKGHHALGADDLDALQHQAQREWTGIQENVEAISLRHNYVEFRKVGYRFFEASKRKWGGEKGLDVAMAVDMVTLAPAYDACVVVSGDADFVPAIQAVKNMGRLVVVPEFKTDGGAKTIPMQAPALLAAADAVRPVEAQSVRGWLGIK